VLAGRVVYLRPAGVSQTITPGRICDNNQRGYGYTADRSAIVEAEASVIREFARRALAGESLNEMAHDLNARGIPTSTGRAWSRSALKLVLISARISGRREYRPTDSYESGHKPLPGEITATGR
jgi:site-specific DNA recombinase